MENKKRVMTEHTTPRQAAECETGDHRSVYSSRFPREPEDAYNGHEKYKTKNSAMAFSVSLKKIINH